MNSFEDYSRIRFSRDGRILSIILKGTTPMNAVDGQMHHELSRVFIEAQDDPDSDLIILTGDGRAFCAGGDAA